MTGFSNLQTVNWRRGALGAGLFAAVLGLGNGLFQIAKMVAPQEVSAMELPNLQIVNWQGVYDVAVGALILVIPAALSWYTRNFLKSAENQKRLSMIATLANAAINYAEDCERRGERELLYNNLDLPESLARSPSPGQQKLCLASSWLAEETKRLGLKRVSIEEATKWVAAEFQKSVGDLRATHSVSSLTDLAADLLNQLGRGGHITLPGNMLETVSLIQSVADWATSQLGNGNSDKFMQRETAMARIAPKTLMMAGASGRSVGKISPEVRLTLVAKQAVEFVSELQKQGKLKMSDRDTATAWLIQQVQQDDIPATREQIEKAIATAFEQRHV